MSESDLNKFLNSLETHSEGHLDTEGKLSGEKNIDMEIRNKISRISTQIYLWQRKKANEEIIDQLGRQSLEKLVQMFPEKKDFIQDLIGKNQTLEKYQDVFNPREE